jgi:putative transcriptional regulator
VPSKAKPLTDAQLRAYETKRDLAAELLESVQQMKAGKTKVIHSPATEARERNPVCER